MEPIKIDITILAPVQKVWDYYNDPKHITKWNFAHESWQCPSSENDLKVGGNSKTEWKRKTEASDLISKGCMMRLFLKKR
jgi:uncharacterized protein YndB with AHSA1/START domain